MRQSSLRGCEKGSDIYPTNMIERSFSALDAYPTCGSAFLFTCAIFRPNCNARTISFFLLCPIWWLRDNLVIMKLTKIQEYSHFFRFHILLNFSIYLWLEPGQVASLMLSSFSRWSPYMDTFFPSSKISLVPKDIIVESSCLHPLKLYPVVLCLIILF